MSLNNLWQSVVEFHKHWGTTDLVGQKRVLWEEYGEYLYEKNTGINDEELIEEAVDMIVVAMGLIYLLGKEYDMTTRLLYDDPCEKLFECEGEILFSLCNNIIYNHWVKYGYRSTFEKMINKVIEKNSKKRKDNGYVLNKHNKIVKA